MFLDKKDLEAMILFNDKTEKLRNNSFTKYAILKGFGMTISAKKDGPVKVEKRHPPEEAVEAFVLTFRFFIQKREASSFNNLAKIYSKLPDYCKKKIDFLTAREECKNFLDSPDNYLRIVENGITLTNKEIFNTFLWGELAHANPIYKKKYDEWMANPIFGPLVQGEFYNILSKVLNSIFYVQERNESLIIDFTYFKL